ncbi:MAG: arginine repressor [Firmicutes bacterium]|nr:arginine repressor [Bacillota bacterium]
MRYKRQSKIIEIINTYEIDTQEKLASMLRESGFEVTQATVSRDIKDLQLVKTQSSSGKYKYALNRSNDMPVSDRFVKIFRETITSFAASGNLIVVKTLSGCANAAGEAIDNSGLPHIIGSIAGDNTLLLVADSADSIPEIMQEFQDMLQMRGK